MKTKLSGEQIEFLQDELQEKFGKELDRLEKQLNHDLQTIGRPSAKTIKNKNELMKRIMKEKRETHDKN